MYPISFALKVLMRDSFFIFFPVLKIIKNELNSFYYNQFKTIKIQQFLVTLYLLYTNLFTKKKNIFF